MQFPDITLQFPADWRDHSSITFAAPPQGNFCRNINITREYLEKPSGLSDYAAVQRAELEKALADQHYQFISDSPMEVAGKNAILRLHGFTIPELQIKVQQAQVYCISGLQAITVTFTDRLDKFKSSFGEFLEILRTFQWLSEDAGDD